MALIVLGTLAAVGPAWGTIPRPSAVPPAGTPELRASSPHPSGQYTAWATNPFTLSSTGDGSATSYDGSGNLTQRVWRASSGATNRIQNLTWDGRNRLLNVSELDTNNTGYAWSAVYDGLGRRLQTTTTPVINGNPITAQASVINQFYDPEVEFLELGVSVNGKTTWKLYGPDLNGAYGGLQGVGGLEAVCGDQNETLVSDLFGHVQGVVTNGAVRWNPTRVSAYGPVPSYPSLPLSVNVPLSQATVWRGKRIDPTGLYWFGARYYDPVAARFISPDPLGHASTPDLFSAFNGDPVNYFDPDGRCATPAGEQSFSTFLGDITYHNGGTSIYSGGMSFFVPDDEGFNPLEGSFDDFHPGEIAADAFLNAQLIKQGWHEVQTRDFSSFAGQAAFGVGVVAIVAGTLDAAGNLLSLGGKGLLENGVKGGLRDAGSTIVKTAPREFEIVNYADKAAGFQNHHGILDKWATENIPGYASRAADSPAIRLSVEGHDATRTVFTEFTKELTGKPIAPLPWKEITPQEIQAFAERAFDAAKVPAGARAAYYRAFYRYIYGGQ